MYFRVFWKVTGIYFLSLQIWLNGGSFFIQPPEIRQHFPNNLLQIFDKYLVGGQTCPSKRIISINL